MAPLRWCGRRGVNTFGSFMCRCAHSPAALPRPASVSRCATMRCWPAAVLVLATATSGLVKGCSPVDDQSCTPVSVRICNTGFSRRVVASPRSAHASCTYVRLSAYLRDCPAPLARILCDDGHFTADRSHALLSAPSPPSRRLCSARLSPACCQAHVSLAFRPSVLALRERERPARFGANRTASRGPRHAGQSACGCQVGRQD
jgi:hypothetical protein